MSSVCLLHKFDFEFDCQITSSYFKEARACRLQPLLSDISKGMHIQMI
jgi:hypothetical protein